MFELQSKLQSIRKRIPLTISRGTGNPTADSILVQLHHTSTPHPGLGEAMAFGIGAYRESTEDIQRALPLIPPLLHHDLTTDPNPFLNHLENLNLPKALIAALDQAVLDWIGKQKAQPWWRLWGLQPSQSPPCSVTIGIQDPDAARKRVQLWRAQLGPIRVFKIKLGSPHGILADQAMFTAVQQEILESSPAHITPSLSIDANGGWDFDSAARMCTWLLDRGIDHVEQPLPRGQEELIPRLPTHQRLPILADESVFNALDIPRIARHVEGINIKTFKCGGLTRAKQMIEVARAHDLQIMLGCYANSSLSNTAAAHLGPLVDYLDLDSHLNLLDDPFHGAGWHDGFLTLPDRPGFGVTFTPPSHDTHP